MRLPFRKQKQGVLIPVKDIDVHIRVVEEYQALASERVACVKMLEELDPKNLRSFSIGVVCKQNEGPRTSYGMGVDSERVVIPFHDDLLAFLTTRYKENIVDIDRRIKGLALRVEIEPQ